MIQYVWLLFTFTFSAFAVYHFWRATKSHPKAPNTAAVKNINGVNLGIHEFIEGFNAYIENLNTDNRRINIWTGIAYAVNAAVALFSYWLVR
jgi:hypothetical protein